jgi:hypothetical protein
MANLATAAALDRAIVACLAETNVTQTVKLEKQATMLTTTGMEVATFKRELPLSKAPIPLPMKI